MKLTTTRFLAAFLTLGSVSYGNLLVNGNFDDPSTTNEWTGSSWVPAGSCTRETWGARSSGYGGVMQGWSANSNGRVYQDVSGLQTGTYTFVIWVKHGVSFNPTDIQLRMEWYNDAFSTKYEDFLTNYVPSARVTGTMVWEPIHLTATFTNPAGSAIRARFYSAWGTPVTNYGEPLVFDDADLYTGAYVPPSYPAAFTNGTFETPTNQASLTWANSGWSAEAMSRQTWAKRSGQVGAWIETYRAGVATAYQEFSATGGVYTFVMHMKRESTDAALRDVRMLVEWCDAERNILQTTERLVTNAPEDALWHQLYVTSAYTGAQPAALVRPRFFARYGAPLGGANAVLLDDAAFYEGGYTNRLLNGSFEDASLGQWTGWGMNNSGAAPWYQDWNPHDGGKVMAFPCWENNGEVLLHQSLYLAPTGTRTFAAWINRESRFGFSNLVLEAKWFNRDFRCIQTNTLNILPGIQDWYEFFLHVNCPAAGGDTNLYEVQLSLRASWGLRTGDNLAMLVDDLRLTDTTYTPSYGASSLQDPDFETPANTNVWTASPWRALGSLARENWDPRSGDRTVAFQSWSAGQALLSQTLATTGGTLTFSGWFKKSIHAQSSNTWLMLEWGGPGGSLLQVDTEVLDDIPADGMAHHVYITGTCTSPGVAFVRPKIWYKFANPKTNNNEVTYFDDAALYAGSYTGAAQFANGDFGATALKNLWDICPGGFAFVHSWGDQAHSGTNGLVFTGWSALPSYQREARVSQTVVTGPGTYTFTVWLKAQLDVDLTNVALRMRWLDKDGAAVQPDSESILAVPRNNNWQSYSITGVCVSASLHEVIPIVAAGWNAAAGEVGFFADDFSLTGGALPDADTDGDGMPDSWEVQFFGSITNSGGAADHDNDGWSDWDEYVAGTTPTNGASNFGVVDNAAGLSRVINITLGPPTTNSRIYDVYWQSNLLGTAWTGYGLNRTGRADGAAITLTVTNVTGSRFYRGGVRVP